MVLLSSIHVFSFPQPVEKLLTIPTQPNTRGKKREREMNVILLFSLSLSLLGLCEVCTSVDCQLMVYPGPKTGSIQISVCYFGSEINVIIVIIHSVCVCVWVTALNKSRFSTHKKSQYHLCIIL